MSGGWVEFYWECDASEWRYELYRDNPPTGQGWNDVMAIPEETYAFLDKARKVYAQAQGLIEDINRDALIDLRKGT